MATATDIETFLRQLAALEDLEVLLWLRGRRGQAVDRATLVTAVGVEAEVLDRALARLTACDVVARDAAGRWRYAASAATDAIVAGIEELVAHDFAAVLKVLSRQAVERIRGAVRRQLLGDGGAR